jgi:hypothetical protein
MLTYLSPKQTITQREYEVTYFSPLPTTQIASEIDSMLQKKCLHKHGA